MASDTLNEIDSFTLKFKSLLANGFKATLTFEAVEGEAFATLKAALGAKCLPMAEDKSYLHQAFKVNSPKKV